MWTDVLREVLVFLGGGACGTYVTYVVDNWRHRRSERVKVIAEARGLLTDELSFGDPFGRPPRHGFMKEPAFFRIEAMLSDEYRRSVAYEGRTEGDIVSAHAAKMRLAAEISRIEREWRLI